MRNRTLHQPQESAVAGPRNQSSPLSDECQHPVPPQTASILRGSNAPEIDQANFIKSNILFWLIGATDGHAKNFSIAIEPGGRFSMTPLYDILTAEPSFASGNIPRNKYRLAMSVGTKRHYQMIEIMPRHFVQTAKRR